jgi:hypothetical protein
MAEWCRRSLLGQTNSHRKLLVQGRKLLVQARNSHMLRRGPLYVNHRRYDSGSCCKQSESFVPMHSPRRRLLPLSANKQIQAVVSFWFSIADRGSAVVPVQLERYDPVPALRKFLEKDDSQIRVLVVSSRAAVCDDSAPTTSNAQLAWSALCLST